MRRQKTKIKREKKIAPARGSEAKKKKGGKISTEERAGATIVGDRRLFFFYSLSLRDVFFHTARGFILPMGVEFNLLSIWL